MQERIIYICSTYYHVYVAILKVWSANISADIIICDDIKEYEELALRLKKAKVFREVITYTTLNVTERRAGRLKYWLKVHGETRKKVKEHLSVDLDKYENIYIFYDGIELGLYLYDCRKEYILLEDAKDFFKIIDKTASGFLLKEAKSRRYIRKILNYGYFPMGQNQYCKSIEVNDTEGILISKEKVVICRKADLQKKVSQEQIKKLFEIFGTEGLNNCVNAEDKVLLLTQPLYKDRCTMTQKEQEICYKYIISQLKERGYRVVLKPHPRDETNYKSLNKDVILLKSSFPIEILNYCGLLFRYAIAISSTAVFGLECVEKGVLLGEEVLESYEKTKKKY